MKSVVEKIIILIIPISFNFHFLSRTSFNSLPSFYFLYLLYLLLQLEATDDGLYAGVLGSGLGDGESNELVTFVGNENG